MRTIAVTATAAVVAGLALTACGSGSNTATVKRYSSAEQVVAVLSKGGLDCTGATDNPPGVSGASSESYCEFPSLAQAQIDVFPGTISKALILKGSASSSAEELWSDYGPNWWVTTSRADATQAQAILGGQIIAVPGSTPQNPPATPVPATAPASPTASANPFATWSSTCTTLANELQSSPYNFTYTASGTTINWNYSPSLTYGQLGNLGTGTDGNKNNLSHLSYLAESVDNSSQLANDLADAGMATANPADGIVPQTVNGVSIYDNSAYDQLQDEQVPASSLSAWMTNYLMPVLNDCAEGD